MFALILRDFDSQFRKTKLGGLLFILEPLIVIMLLAAMRIGLFGARPNYGPSVILFYATGITAFYLFQRCSRGIARIDIRASEYPVIRLFDILAARYCVEILRMLGISLFLFGGLSLYGIEEAIPQSLSKCAASLMLVSVFGFGLGLANSTIGSFFPLWLIVWNLTSRPLLFLSGVLYVVDFLPPFPRSWIVWNPVSHAVEWFRWGFYHNYPVNSLSESYLLICTLGSILAGSMLFSLRRSAN